MGISLLSRRDLTYKANDISNNLRTDSVVKAYDSQVHQLLALLIWQVPNLCEHIYEIEVIYVLFHNVVVRIE